jgi:hypothetical protein
VTVLSFPPNCSHKLQPLDVSVYGPLKTYVKRAGHTVTFYDIPGIVNSSLDHATSTRIKVGFQVSGIYPINRDIFHDEECIGPYVTDRSTPLVAAAAFNSRRILRDHQYLLQRKKHVLFPQRTFDLFLNPDTESVRM